MAAKKLTPAENAWLAKLQAVMQECPSARLACYTVGDNDLTFYDKGVSEKWAKSHPNNSLDAAALHREAGSYLGRVQGAFQIDSCAG